MTRGNQREYGRLRAQKMAAANASKPKESNTALAKRKGCDAEVLRAKQKKKEEERAAAAAAAGGASGITARLGAAAEENGHYIRY